MENISLVKNEQGEVCRKELIENITPLNDEQKAQARETWNTLICRRDELREQTIENEQRIDQFNGVFDEEEEDNTEPTPTQE